MFKTTNGITTSNPQPTAHVTRSASKSRGKLKVYSDNSVYLEKGEEFEIELFNPTQESIVARVEFNGVMISESGIVLKPAQRLFLERYFDNNNKFKFDVYEIEDFTKTQEEADLTSELKQSALTEYEARLKLSDFLEGKELEDNDNLLEDLKRKSSDLEILENELNQRATNVEYASQNNGELTVYFYKEKKQNKPFLMKGNMRNRRVSINDNNATIPSWNNDSGFGGTNLNNVYDTNSSGFGYDNMNLTSSISNLDEDSVNTDAFFNTGLDSLKDVFVNENDNSLDFESDMMETGRVAEGSISNQKFVEVDMEFEQFPFHSINYKLLPTSQKPNEVSDLRKYCCQCGAKLKKTDIFCSKCGTKA